MQGISLGRGWQRTRGSSDCNSSALRHNSADIEDLTQEVWLVALVLFFIAQFSDLRGEGRVAERGSAAG